MKKTILSIIAFFIAIPLIAEETKKTEQNPFKFSGQVYAYGAAYQTTNKEDRYLSVSGYRFRPYFSYITENVETSLKMEFDQLFGQGPSTAPSSDPYNSTYSKTGADTKGVLEVKAAYLKLNVPAIKGLSVKGGVDEYVTPGGFMLGTEIGLGLISYELNQNKISVVYLKPNENFQTSEADDASVYGLDVLLVFGSSLKLRPAFYLAKGGNAISAAPWKNSAAFIPALGVSFKMDSLSLDMNATYGSGKDKVANVKYSGYAVDVAPNYEISKTLKAGVFFTLLSGDDGSSTTEKKNFSSFQLKYDGFGRMFLMEQKEFFTSADYNGFADVRKNQFGYMLIGATFKQNWMPLK